LTHTAHHNNCMLLDIYNADFSNVPSVVYEGATENAGAAKTKMQGWKTREWKTRHQTAVCRGGKRESNKYGKPKFPLFNIVTSGLQQPIELM